MKINVNMPSMSKMKIESHSGFQQAQSRFQNILATKLNIRPSNGNMTKVPHTVEAMISDVRLHSGATQEMIEAKLKGTPMAGLSESFIRAEKDHGVNALFLTSLAIHESGYGRSAIARDKNNLFGFQAFDRSPYQSARTFSSFEESIDHVAGYLSRAYLNENGSYFSGYSVESINTFYATDPKWSDGITKLMKSF